MHDSLARARATTEPLKRNSWGRLFRYRGKELLRLLSNVKYDTQSAISTWIGDVKISEPRRGKSLITPEQVARLEDILQPGDILIERRNWYMSNAFLPGYWPHAALYVGTADDLRRMGLDKNEYVKRHLTEFAKPDEEGHPRAIVEALSEGVVFASLEHSIGGGDSAAVLRPRLTSEEIERAIVLAFSHAGKPYDFEFDFESHDKLVCTEVVYRAYGSNRGSLVFPLKTIMGRRTMPALELVRKFHDELGVDDPQLEFVAFIDGNEETGESVFYDDPAEFLATLDRPALTFLQGSEKTPLAVMGMLGWFLAGTSLLMMIGNLIYYARQPARRGRKTG
jgi:hypothetical protein